MEWYIPITILPGVGMLIMSTTGQMMSLSTEIGNLLSEKCTPFQHKLSHLKIEQLNKLTVAVTLFYISAACFVLSGVMGALVGGGLDKAIPNYILLTGVVLVFVALSTLIVYSFKAIRIRRQQHEHNHEHFGVDENT